MNSVLVDARIHVPVEILANLVYLTNRCAGDEEKVRLLMRSAKNKSLRLPKSCVQHCN
jgi:hypothetical protein